MNAFAIRRQGAPNRLVASVGVILAWAVVLSGDGNIMAPTGTLRAVYLSGNAAQATLDPTTGEVRGIAADLLREFGRRLNVPVQLTAVVGVAQAIEAVRSGDADIGFLASDPSRRGPIDFSQVYLRNPQSLIVPKASSATSVADLDKPLTRIGATRGDSMALFLSRTLRQGRLVELPIATASDLRTLFQRGEIDAFGASRLRLSALADDLVDFRILPGSVFGVPQAIIVPAAQPERLAEVNRFIDMIRKDGFLQRAIDRADVGVEIEPAP